MTRLSLREYRPGDDEIVRQGGRLGWTSTG